MRQTKNLLDEKKDLKMFVKEIFEEAVILIIGFRK
jgi:hypothetical protein